MIEPAFHEPVRRYASTTLVWVRPNDTLDAVARVLEERSISAAPVLGAQGALIGIVSTSDLLRAVELELDPMARRCTVRPTARTAAEVMRSPVVTVRADAPVREAARLMVAHRIHRVVVQDGGRACGVLSTRDVMVAVLRHRVTTPLSAVMTRAVETVELGDSVEVAMRHLAETNVRGLVVVDDGWPVGVFTHTEAIRARALPRALLVNPVEHSMSYEMLCLPTDTPLHRVAGHAVAMNVRRVLAVEARHLRGIASGFDLAGVAALE